MPNSAQQCPPVPRIAQPYRTLAALAKIPSKHIELHLHYNGATPQCIAQSFASPVKDSTQSSRHWAQHCLRYRYRYRAMTASQLTLFDAYLLTIDDYRYNKIYLKLSDLLIRIAH